MMEHTEFLPLGTIIILKGGIRKAMIIARAVAVNMKEENKYFEYGGCLYPEGLLGEAVLYFNNEDIHSIVQKGYADEDDKIMQDNLNAAIEKTEMKKANTEEWKKNQGGRKI